MMWSLGTGGEVVSATAGPSETEASPPLEATGTGRLGLLFFGRRDVNVPPGLRPSLSTMGKPAISRRAALAAGLSALASPAWATTLGERLAKAARSQVGVTNDYNPAYVGLAYPGGDLPRSTGVCADVIVRASRD